MQISQHSESNTGLPHQGKQSGKLKKKNQVRENLGNFIFSQGSLEKKNKKVMVKSGNFKIFEKKNAS